MNRLLIPIAIAVTIPAAVVGITAAVVTRGDEAQPPAVSADAGMRVWIDHPLSGAAYPLGTTIPVRWHASHPAGIASVRVLANGELLFADDGLGEDAIASRRHEWTPRQPGEYALDVEALGSGDVPAITVSHQVIITGEGTPAATPTALAPTTTAEPARTNTPPASTATTAPRASATSAPAATPTSTPPPPPPASPTTPPQPQPTSTPTAVPPAPTSTPAPDTVAPPAPYQVAPKGTEFGCPATVILSWLEPQDPSGIQSYTVQLEQKVTATTWAPVDTYPNIPGLSKNLTSPAVQCGGIYRWRVRARDNAGNTGPYSGWEQFGIILP